MVDAEGEVTTFSDKLWEILRPELLKPADPAVQGALLEAVAYYYAIYGMAEHPHLDSLSATMRERARWHAVHSPGGEQRTVSEDP